MDNPVLGAIRHDDMLETLPGHIRSFAETDLHVLRLALEAAWAEIEQLKGEVAKVRWDYEHYIGHAPTDYPKEADDGTD